MILGAPSVDITNQDVTKGILEENTTETIASAHHMVDAADYALASGQVNQVILMEHTPRYDTPNNDPYEAKPHLARLANETLKRAVSNARHRDRMMVGCHCGLQTGGQARAELMTNCGNNWRSRNVKVGKYDGIHYYSREGQVAMTGSLLAVLKQAGLEKSPKPLPASPKTGDEGQDHNQWHTVGRGPRGVAPAPTAFQIPLSNRYEGNW